MIKQDKKSVRILNPMKAVLFHGSTRIDTSVIKHKLTDEVIHYLRSIGFNIEVLEDENK